MWTRRQSNRYKKSFIFFKSFLFDLQNYKKYIFEFSQVNHKLKGKHKEKGAT